MFEEALVEGFNRGYEFEITIVQKKEEKSLHGWLLPFENKQRR